MSNKFCELCERQLQRGTTEHHLIPRTLHRNKWFRKRYTKQQMCKTVSLCRDCHGSIHRFVPSEKELGRDYNTLELLKAHPMVRGYLKWVRKRN